MMRWPLLVISLLALLLLYYSSGYFFVYNNDAYVSADIVKMATPVSGVVKEIPVADNQAVEAGELLLALHQKPFLYTLEATSGALDKVLAEQGSLPTRIEEAHAELEIARDNEALAGKEFNRYRALFEKGNVSREYFDERRSSHKVTQAELAQKKEAYELIQQQAAVLAGQVRQLQGEQALAQYHLDISRIYAPADGYINNLKVYPGDYAAEGSALFGFVKKDSLRVVANIKDTNLMMLHPGKKVWVYLSNHPWQLFRGEVESIGRAVARASTAEDAALPYVEPVTSWIRYSYRLPVRIHLVEFPPDKALYVGVDARVFVFR